MSNPEQREIASNDRALTGVAHIKPEFVLPRTSAPTQAPPDDDAAEGGTKALKRTGSTLESSNADLDARDKEVLTEQKEAEGKHVDGRDATGGEAGRNGQGGKRQRRDLKENGKVKGGQNKGRKFKHVKDEVEMCNSYASTKACNFGEKCNKSHSLPIYLANKGPDIIFPPSSSLSSLPPYIHLDPSNLPPIVCPTFSEIGYCPQGFKCRFLAAHVTRKEGAAEEDVGELVEEEGGEKRKRHEAKFGIRGERNWVDIAPVKALRQNSYQFPIADPYLASLEGGSLPYRKQPAKTSISLPTPAAASKPKLSEEEEAMNEEEEEMASLNLTEEEVEASRVEAGKDADDAQPVRAEEKKRLDWTGKTYLAPLTTTGNLPFRRLCVSLGADITCSEMGLAASFLQGAKSEWALTKRHSSEKTFGVQVAGSKPAQLVPAAEAIVKECTSLDFVDVNLGCPIDLVFNKGAGSALFDSPGKLGKILVGMSKALGETPLTVKMRTGIKDNKNIAHKLIPKFATEWGCSAMTLHGRSRQQRYSKLADWNYIRECADTLRESCAEANLPIPPIFGNGDCFSYQSYADSIAQTGVDGVMIARGALIKPWIFTEIQEKREWDISSRERLDLIRQFAEYGLSHWGSDTIGINTTRRFLCESLSFTHRYIPLGICEVPAKMNDRPPPFKGRDELETLLASEDSRDWVRISEMFLGKAPEDFSFLAKHKSSSYGPSEEAQG